MGNENFQLGQPQKKTNKSKRDTIDSAATGKMTACFKQIGIVGDDAIS